MSTHWLDNPQWHAYFSKLFPRTTLEKALYKAYTTYRYSKYYKCMNGTKCKNSMCTHLHPFDDGYIYAPYFQSDQVCPYETETTACRLKCGAKTGKYCYFSHCTHDGMTHMTMSCFLSDCQRHCPQCI